MVLPPEDGRHRLARLSIVGVPAATQSSSSRCAKNIRGSIAGLLVTRCSREALPVRTPDRAGLLAYCFWPAHSSSSQPTGIARRAPSHFSRVHDITHDRYPDGRRRVLPHLRHPSSDDRTARRDLTQCRAQTGRTTSSKDSPCPACRQEQSVSRSVGATSHIAGPLMPRPASWRSRIEGRGLWLAWRARRASPWSADPCGCGPARARPGLPRLRLGAGAGPAAPQAPP
jgi:hypothetical protein